MRTAYLLPIAFLALTATAPLPRRLAAPPTISDLSWLEGTWRGRIGGRDFEARYTGTDGGQVLSASKYSRNGRADGFEFERFAEENGKLVLTPHPEGKASVTFDLGDYDPKARRAMFENLAHDFPTRISYQRVSKDRLTILVSGPGEDGKEQVLQYSLEKKRER